ncbi:hypothetical protein B0H14DRAFT_1063842 [Mycena olivaceomarginata]|nr:hypothetical protein B0H14DRAFT_1063842 [Mycena olivaceomarginata]
MLHLDAILTLCAVLLVTLAGTNAQAKFEWGFSQTVSTSLPSCQTFPITADPLTAHGVPPFYMIAYAVGGAPITSSIGTNESNLSWTVTHPIGTQLLLGVFDSQGNTGGIDVPLYTVTKGSSTSCIPPPPPAEDAPPPFTITANVTDTLTTCQPWGLTIHGGIPPYNVTLVALNSTVVTNQTLGADDSVLTYINRQEPNLQVLAAVNDLNGRWATGSPFVHTQGSADLTCRGLDSTSSNGTSPSPQGDKNGSRSRHIISHGTIGAIVGAIVGALLLCGVATWMWRQWQQRRAQQRPRIEIDSFNEGPSTTDVWDINMQPHRSSVLVSTNTGTSFGGKERHRQMATGSLAPTSELSSSTNTSPLTSPHLGVQELPPSLLAVSPSTARRLASKESRCNGYRITRSHLGTPFVNQHYPRPLATRRRARVTTAVHVSAAR